MLAHRKRRPTPSQGLENRALRVVQASAMAASRGLDDAPSIAGTPAPHPPPCLDDAGHDYFSDRLLASKILGRHRGPTASRGGNYGAATEARTGRLEHFPTTRGHLTGAGLFAEEASVAR